MVLIDPGQPSFKKFADTIIIFIIIIGKLFDDWGNIFQKLDVYIKNT